jgi:hypothetical protein
MGAFFLRKKGTGGHRFRRTAIVAPLQRGFSNATIAAWIFGFTLPFF